MASAPNNNQTPECFADLATVFPMGPEGLREVSEECWPCHHRVECLRRAVNTPGGGRDMEEDRGRREQEAVGGVTGFLRRWSRLKQYSKKKEG